jgi:hypothetical protein
MGFVRARVNDYNPAIRALCAQQVPAGPAVMPPPGEAEACAAQQAGLAGVVRHPVFLFREVLANGLAQVL